MLGSRHSYMLNNHNLISIYGGHDSYICKESNGSGIKDVKEVNNVKYIYTYEIRVGLKLKKILMSRKIKINFPLNIQWLQVLV